MLQGVKFNGKSVSLSALANMNNWIQHALSICRRHHHPHRCIASTRNAHDARGTCQQHFPLKLLMFVIGFLTQLGRRLLYESNIPHETRQIFTVRALF